jgi:uncharacterized membrane protein YuzA (DUF378 family)
MVVKLKGMEKLKNQTTSNFNINETDIYLRYTGRKKLVLVVLACLIILVAIVAVNAGSMNLNLYQVIQSILGNGSNVSDVVIWRIRLPRILAAILPVLDYPSPVVSCKTISEIRWLHHPPLAYPMLQLLELIWPLLFLAQAVFQVLVQMR